jgi:integral membrane protein
MAAMTGAFDRQRARAGEPGDGVPVAGWFRLVALLEVVSWIGLLIGMYFKYLGSPRTEVGVKVFGMVHGLVFIAFVVAGLLTGIALRWATGTWLLALLGSVVPLCSVMFLIWADRTGRMALPVADSAVAQPGRPVPETT